MSDIQQTHHEECWRQRRHHDCAVAKIERLTAQVKTLESDDHEWYLQSQEIERLTDRIAELEAKLHRIEQWCKAYPRTVFIEPTKEQWAAADKALNRSDCPSLTAISGSNMRHVVEGIQAIAALEDKL